MPTNEEAAAVKGRRQSAVKADATKLPEGNVTGTMTPPAVGVAEPARNFFVLGDPREERQVLEASGGMFYGIAGDDFVVAPEEAHETIVPKGCKQAVSRLRWAAGHHVPIEVFRAHYGDERAAELLRLTPPAPAAPAPLP